MGPPRNDVRLRVGFYERVDQHTCHSEKAQRADEESMYKSPFLTGSVLSRAMGIDRLIKNCHSEEQSDEESVIDVSPNRFLTALRLFSSSLYGTPLRAGF